MKKFLALALAIVMMMAMAVPAFAATTVDQSSDPKTGSVNVTYTVQETYTVSIPADLTFDPKTLACPDLTIGATEVRIQGDQTLNVTVASTNGAYDSANNKWYLKADAESGSDNVQYFVKKVVTTPTPGEEAINSGANILAVETPGGTVAGTGSVTLKITTVGTAQVGTYTDTLTFTVSID